MIVVPEMSYLTRLNCSFQVSLCAAAKTRHTVRQVRNDTYPITHVQTEYKESSFHILLFALYHTPDPLSSACSAAGFSSGVR